jgi:hypothetical protein
MKQLLTIVLIAFSLNVSHAQSEYYSRDGVAIKGYDPVAYFIENAAIAGKKDFSYTWQGTEWRFKDQANLDAFKAAPEKYAPQFGGYCAYGASENHKSPTEPSAFTVIDGKLYLNYNMKVKELWIQDTKGHIKKAEDNWVTLRHSAN